MVVVAATARRLASPMDATVAEALIAVRERSALAAGSSKVAVAVRKESFSDEDDGVRTRPLASRGAAASAGRAGGSR